MLITNGTYKHEVGDIVGKGRGWFYVELPSGAPLGHPNKPMIVPVRSAGFVYTNKTDSKVCIIHQFEFEFS